jgi:hypothetical protein
MLSTPTHTTYKLQPFRQNFNEAFRSNPKVCSSWMRRNPDLRRSVFDIAGLVNEAFIKVYRMELASSGFFCTVICTVNRNSFKSINFYLHKWHKFPNTRRNCPFWGRSQWHTFLLLSLAPQPNLGLGLLQKIRLNFLEASQQFSFLQGRVVSPTLNPHPGVPGLFIYIPQRQGGYPF